MADCNAVSISTITTNATNMILEPEPASWSIDFDYVTEEVRQRMTDYIDSLMDDNAELKSLVLELEASVHSLMEQINE